MWYAEKPSAAYFRLQHQIINTGSECPQQMQTSSPSNAGQCSHPLKNVLHVSSFNLKNKTKLEWVKGGLCIHSDGCVFILVDKLGIK